MVAEYEFPDTEEKFDRYKNIYESLKTTELIDNERFLYLKLVTEDDDDFCSYTDVTMSIDGIIDSRIGLDFVEWGECLNLKVNPVMLDTYEVPEILSHFVYEITFYGASNDEVQAKYKKICDDVDAIRSGEMETTKWEDFDFEEDDEDWD